MNLPATEVVICDTKVKHALVSTSYNERRRECEHAVELVQAEKPEVSLLSDLDTTDFSIINQLPEPERRRARHVVTENERTLQAVEALKRNDVVEIGHLMIQSHESLRNDFEVSCRELDIMFDWHENRKVFQGPACGGGFGGSHKYVGSRSDFVILTAGYKPALAVFRERCRSNG